MPKAKSTFVASAFTSDHEAGYSVSFQGDRIEVEVNRNSELAKIMVEDSEGRQVTVTVPTHVLIGKRVMATFTKPKRDDEEQDVDFDELDFG